MAKVPCETEAWLESTDDWKRPRYGRELPDNTKNRKRPETFREQILEFLSLDGLAICNANRFAAKDYILHNVRAIRANRLKPTIHNVCPPQLDSHESGQLSFCPQQGWKSPSPEKHRTFVFQSSPRIALSSRCGWDPLFFLKALFMEQQDRAHHERDQQC